MAVEAAAAGAGGRLAGARGRGRGRAPRPRAGRRRVAAALSVAGVVSYARWALSKANKYSGVDGLENLYLLSFDAPGNGGAGHGGAGGGAPRSSRKLPRVVAIDYDYGDGDSEESPLVSLSRLVSLSPPQEIDWKGGSVPKHAPWISPDWYGLNAIDYVRGYDLNKCEPIDEDQFRSYPNCNAFHELDLSHMRLVGSGGSRLAFEMPQPLAGGGEAKFCYKTAKYHKDVDSSHVEEQRKDAWIMERTPRSQFITSVHGYCSLGIMMDFMAEGDMHDYTKGARLAGGSTLPPVDRLKISIHIATSVADLHEIHYFHNDIWSAQMLFQNGIFKLSDFNYARPLYKPKASKWKKMRNLSLGKKTEYCRMESFGMYHWKGRSLEEHQIHHGDPKFEPVSPEVVDVWMMGTLLYTILTDLYPFEKPVNLSTERTGEALIAGKRPKLPERIRSSQDPSHVAVKKALNMCWTQDWKQRPSARKISDFLIGRLRKITGEADPDLRVVLPERDPHQTNTFNDFDKYNEVSETAYYYSTN